MNSIPKNHVHMFVWLATFVVGLIVTNAPTLRAGGEMKKKQPTLVRATHLVYDALREGESIGKEEVIRRVMDNNTIEFVVQSVASPAAQVTIRQSIDVKIAEDTHFPRSYSVHKVYETGGVQQPIEHEIDIEMISNVAVITTQMSGKATDHRQVVPTGTAFIELNIVTLMEQLLYWYDDTRGGVQSFDAMDVASSKLETITVEFARKETLSVLGEEIETDAYRVQRPNYEVTLFVDIDRRIVRMSQYQFDLVLTQWSETTYAEQER